MKNQIEGLPYYIGDKVRFSYYNKCVSENTNEFIKTIWEWMFGRKVKNPDLNTHCRFTVVRMSVKESMGSSSGCCVKVQYKNLISEWMDSGYFKKAK